MDDFNPQQDTLLDSALNELPMAPLPSGFTTQVMAAIQAEAANPTARTARQTQPYPTIRFRLQPLDVALALFWSLVLIVIWLTTLWWTGALTIDWLPPVQANFSLVEKLSFANPGLLLAGVILVILELSVLGLVGFNLLGERPTVG